MERKRAFGELSLVLSAVVITALAYVGVQLWAGDVAQPSRGTAAVPRQALQISGYVLPFVTVLLGALVVYLAVRLRRRRADLTDARELHSAYLDSSPDGVVVIGSDGRVIEMNSTARRQFGCEPGNYGQSFFGELVESFDGVDSQRDSRQVAGDQDEPGVARCRRLDGGQFDAEVICNPLLQSKDIGYVCYLRDHTRRLTARFASQHAERRYEALFNDVSDGVFHATADNVVTAANPAFVNMLGFRNEHELLAQETRIYMSPVDERGHALRAGDAPGAAPDTLRNVRVFARRRDGVQLALLANIRLLRDAAGRISSSQGTLTQVAESDARKVESARDEHQAALLRYALELSVVVTQDGTILYASPASERVLGVPPQRMLGERVFDYLRADERAAVEATLRSTLEVPGRTVSVEHQLQHALGEWRLFESAVHTFRAPDGRVRAVIFTRDVTARRKSEEQLLQSRKMAAVRHLTGGLARRFEALIADIAASSAAAPPAPEGAAGGHRDAAEADLPDPVQRGAELTRQLLAFSQSEVQAPEVIDLNDCLARLEPTLQDSLRKPAALEIRYSHALWPTLVDATELERAILNLVRNASDAVGDNGTLIIETYNTTLSADAVGFDPDLTAGDYAVLGVVDDGSGMAQDVLGQAFDPFFTTRDSLERSGLGLSMVYGFAKQSGGQIRLRSQPGGGTVASLYLPRWRERQEALPRPAEAGAPLRGSETVLAVDDDPEALAAVARMLEGLGYRVVRADSGAEALAHPELGQVDLVLCEMAMMRMTGTRLAQALCAIRPALPVLLTSGYAQVYADEHDAGERQFELLQKPVTRETLASRIRGLLDAPAAPPALAGQRPPSPTG